MESANASNEVLRGVGEIFAPTDVYGIANLDQKAATILLRGAVTESLDPASKAIDGPKNNPMMPLAWLREYAGPNGTAKGRAFCTTLGASSDFADEDLRRLVVNVSHALLGLKVPDKADVAYVDAFEPTFYGTNNSAFYKTLNRKPGDYALGKSPATGKAASKPADAKPAAEKKDEVLRTPSMSSPPPPRPGAINPWPPLPKASALYWLATVWPSATFTTVGSRRN
ncbi:hypothetical protein [Verrucomicrobium spinosum]|uniref:hypothetical protein n=1 Tax=Verrucomicrobium spinosum TaxID=2736 RepID=UPI000946561F|nr:hypothetical protein [Verrucomicrobium spinosum]